MEEKIEKIEAEMNRVDLKEVFEYLGIQTYIRMKSENKITQLQKANDELQKMMKAQVEPKD